MESQMIMLIIIMIVVVIILIIQFIGIYYINSLYSIGKSISDDNYKSLRPLYVDVIRNVAIPETQAAVNEQLGKSIADIKKFIEDILKKKINTSL